MRTSAPELVDTHCHLNFQHYENDLATVLERARAAGTRRIIIPAVDLAGSQEIHDLCQETSAVFGAVGIHPNHSAVHRERMDTAIAELAALASAPKIRAIGEIGLDFYRQHTKPAEQEKALRAQLRLAARLQLPVILHNREATTKLLPILEEWAANLAPPLRDAPGVLHSFSADWAAAERALAAGFYLGIGGALTFPKGKKLKEVAQRAPLQRLLLETDGPYLTPVPKRGQRNEPAYLPWIAERLANLRACSFAEVARVTTANAERLFGLP